MWQRIVGSLVVCALSLLLVPRVVETQPVGKIYRLGWLSHGERPDLVQDILAALAVLGYVESQHLVLERRIAAGREELPVLAAELVTRQVDLLLTWGTAATRAAKQATTTIPIVFRLAIDPVESGLVASYARPGGNLTGVAASLYEDKLLALLQEAVPGLRRIACPLTRKPDDPGWVQITDAAQRLGLEIVEIALQGPEDFAPFFATARQAGVEAVLVPNHVGLNPHLRRLGELTAQYQVPAINFHRSFAEGGGLLAYTRTGAGADRTAAQVVKILQGEPPAAIPVEQPAKFALIINLKTAKALGRTLPPTVLLQAEEVIQ